MAGKVFDASLREGIDPELAFRLVRLESEFNARAVSKVGAIGLTQSPGVPQGEHPPSSALGYGRFGVRRGGFAAGNDDNRQCH